MGYVEELCDLRDRLEVENEALQARVKELKAERDAWKSAAQEAGLRTYDGLAQENARLRKVVDAAREYLDLCTGADSDELRGLLALKDALRELDDCDCDHRKSCVKCDPSFKS